MNMPEFATQSKVDQSTRYQNKWRGRFYSQAEIIRLTGLSRTTIWRLERAGNFPARQKISANRVGWRESEIMNWMDNPEAA